MKINTLKFKELLNKAVKGSSFNKFLPITSLIKIELKSGLLELMTYDGKNYIKITESNVEGDDLYVVVNSDIITKLINKSTSEFTTLELTNEKLTVKTNGIYTIEIPAEEGNIIKYPELKFDFNTAKSITVDTQLLKNTLASNKPSLAQTADIISMMGYYIDSESVITTDSFVVTDTKTKLAESEVLLTPEFVNLISLVSSEKTTIYYNESNVAVSGGEVVIMGRYLEGIDTFPVDTIKGLVSQEFNSMCKVPRTALIDVLDRMSLFVNDYDKNSIDIVFEESELRLTTKKTTGQETIVYTESSNAKPYKCSVDVEMLRQQLLVQTSEIAEIWFGSEFSIKLVDGNITQILATTVDEE